MHPQHSVQERLKAEPVDVLWKGNYILIPTLVTGAWTKTTLGTPFPLQSQLSLSLLWYWKGSFHPQPSQLARDAASSLLPTDRSCPLQRRNLPAACSGFCQAKGKAAGWSLLPTGELFTHDTQGDFTRTGKNHCLPSPGIIQT